MHVPQEHTYERTRHCCQPRLHDYHCNNCHELQTPQCFPIVTTEPSNQCVRPSGRRLLGVVVRSFVRSFVATSLGVREFRDRRIRRSSFVVRSFVVRSFVRRLLAVVGGQSDEIPIIIVLQYVLLHNRLSACFGRGYMGVTVRKDTLWKYGV